MILRIYEPSAKFGILTEAYHDYECDTFQVYSGMLQLMRFGRNDVYIPLSSMKLFEKLPAALEQPTKQLTDSDLQDEAQT